jgi:asparagine synthase (glutamine-hydrolysing)
MKVILSKYKWYSDKNVRVTGFIRIGSKYLEGDSLVNHFTDAEDAGTFEKILKSANGQFSVIIRTGAGVIAGTDRLRNYPLFYAKINGEFVIGDDCYKLAEMLPAKQFNHDAVDSFLGSGYVINNLTLIKDIFQVEAGGYVSLEREVMQKDYYEPEKESIIDIDIQRASHELNDLFQVTFRNHLKALEDKFIVIPLSGGYDSRLVAAMVARYHPENVLCYTYGRKDNYDVAPAKEAAEKLGFRWINIIYDSELIRNYLNDKYFRDYYPYVAGLSGMFFLQEYFAVRYLKDNGLIPDGSVFMSGFSGDMLAGSYLIPSMKNQMSREKISKLILRDYFRLITLDNKKKSAILEQIKKRIPDNNPQAWRVFETWDIRERHAKFIVNSAKVFRYFGYEYIFPLWDNLFVDYMLRLPFHLKMNRILYEFTLREYVFRQQDLNLKNEVNPKAVKKSIQRMKEMIKPLLPDRFINHFLDLKSPILYDEITAELYKERDEKEFVRPLQPNYYNSYITQWYLIKTREELGIVT